MKKFLFSCLLFIVTCVNAQINLGVGSTTTGIAPISTYYGYSYVQQIFPKTEINAAAAGNITGLKFYLNASSTLTNSSSWVVYLGHTTKTSFTSNTDWIPVAGLTQVFTGTVTNNAGVVEITLPTPFAYNNVDNLVIAARETSANYDSNGFAEAMYVYNTATDRSIYYRNDTTNPNPATPPTAGGRNGYNSVTTILGLTPSAIPACPTVTAPAAAATGVSLTPAITWNAVSGATGYRLSVGTTSGGTNIINNQDLGNVTTFTIPAASGLQYNTQYYYTVSSYNATNPSAVCSVRSFTTQTIPCPAVSAPAAGAVGVSLTPTITWAAVTGATGYRLTMGTTTGGTQTINNLDVGNVTSYTLPTPLANSTQYFYKVNSYNAGGSSASCTERNFRTVCTAITTLQWTENFDTLTPLGAGLVPSCWAQVTGTSAWTSSNAAASTTSPGPRSAPNYMRIQYGNTNPSQLWTPSFALTAGTTYEFSFYYHTGGTSSNLVGYTGNVLVNTAQNMTGATNLGTFITATQGTAAYKQYKIYYTPTASGNYNFGLNVSSTFAPWYLGVDDFKLRLAPSCIEPQGVSILTASTSGATVQWTVPATPPANGYDVYYSTTTTPPATPQFTGVTGPTQAITGLAANTTYYIWIKAKCSATDISDFSDPISVFTGYCVPSGGSSSTSYYLKTISTTGGITNLNYTANSYSAYVNNSATNFSVVPGGVVNFSMNVGTSSYYYYIWIDWNNDLVFDTTTEQVYFSGNYLTGNATGTITSVGHPSGSYRARFAASYIGTMTPCGSAPYGNYVDFTYIIKPCSTTAPNNVTISGITNSSATVSWTPIPDNLNYIVQWREQGTTGWPPANTSTIINAPTATYTINNVLLPSKIYEVQVTSICGTTYGTPSPVTVFSTLCDPTPPSVTVNQITSTSAMVNWSAVPNATFALQYRKVGDVQWLPVAAPGYTPVTGTSYLLQNLDPYTKYEVRVANICVGTTTVNPYSTPVVFTTERICSMPPPGLTITQLAPTTAVVVWDPFPGATYILSYRKVGIPSWTNVPVSINTYTITGLLELTKYEMKVVNVCNGTPGTYTAPYYFTTPTVVYCQMSGASAVSESISKVTVKPTGKPQMINDVVTGLGYSDFTGISAKFIEMIQGSTGNQIIVDKKLSSGSKGGVAVWIDFNRNGTFDLNERILADGPNENTTASATFSVPADAFVSMTDYKYVVMRVAMAKDGIPVNCTNFANGEVEDYTVRISKLPVANALNQTDIMIYPNPVKSILNVKNISKKANYKIYSAAGQVISSGVILNNKIDVSRLINGVYTIDIDDVQGTAQKKFIKE
ncbi:fibronectin type III domain-containing protein [Chryseobacterium sp. GP-SGM7]|uniref:fibronectin type III domain-containing protein n=1 Tax=Chryseobacterium sp. GP-SGM7 TaxID=3411323 RepID=UPI003B95B6F5